MSPRQRLTFAAIAAVIAVVAVVILAAGGSDDSGQEAAAPTATPPAQTGTSEPETTPEPTPEPTPEATRIRVRAGQPVGGPAKITVKQGEQVRFTVDADAPEHVHVHGYDFMEDVGPGQRAKFSFKAKITGIFEIELENSGTLIASLRVNP